MTDFAEAVSAPGPSALASVVLSLVIDLANVGQVYPWVPGIVLGADEHADIPAMTADAERMSAIGFTVNFLLSR
jgi:hypothetical protein